MFTIPIPFRRPHASVPLHNNASITLHILCYALLAIATISSQTHAQDIYADVLCHYNPGDHVNSYYLDDSISYNDPMAALYDPSATVLIGYYDNEPIETTVVSLGGWTKSNAAEDECIGLIVGFSTAIANGVGPDLLIAGNPFTYGDEAFREPGFVEVACESSATGATTDGWIDETFYLIQPSNYDLLPHDPRTAPCPVTFQYPILPWYSDPEWESQTTTGYADYSVSGDQLDLDNAIDINGISAQLPDISYIRFRTVSDSTLGIFGHLTTEIDYIQALNGYAAITISGDYNNDGTVDQADYTIWADSYGQIGPQLDADGNHDQIIDQADYTIWADNYGQTNDNTSNPTQIPEPTTLAFAILGTMWLARQTN